MKFSLVSLTALLAGTTLAHPSAMPAEPLESDGIYRDASGEISINEANYFNTVAASCSILRCVEVIGSAICIAAAIESDNYAAILKCASKKELCGCAGCIKPLRKFLEKHHVC